MDVRDSMNTMNKYLIYVYTSPSGKSYVGQTNNMKRREQGHKSDTGCRAFHSAIKKYGIETFERTVICAGLTLEQANVLEQWWIKCLRALSPSGYNLTAGGHNSTLSEEHKAKISASSKGKKLSEATRAKMSAAKIGNKYFLGHEHSAESKAQIGAAKIGKKYHLGHKHSAEARSKISVAHMGNKYSLGHKHSAETRAKISNIRKHYWALRHTHCMTETGSTR